MTQLLERSSEAFKLGRKFRIPLFSADVYHGGPIHPRCSDDTVGGKPIVIDIAGASVFGFGRKTPVLYAHDRNDPIGHTTRVDLLGDRITAEGVLSVPGHSRDRVVGAARSGYRWAVSLGFEAWKEEHLPPMEQATVNQQLIHGPVCIYRSGRLIEISLLPVGADRHASAEVGNASGRCHWLPFLPALGDTVGRVFVRVRLPWRRRVPPDRHPGIDRPGSCRSDDPQRVTGSESERQTLLRTIANLKSQVNELQQRKLEP